MKIVGGLFDQAIRFGLVGFANTALTLIVIFAFQTLTPVGPYWANVIGYGVGLLSSFLLNSRWTFGVARWELNRAAKFLVAFAIAYGANLLVIISPAYRDAGLHCGIVLAVSNICV